MAAEEAGPPDQLGSQPRAPAPVRARELDDVAWRVISDLCTPDGVFASLPPEGLQRLIQERLEREAVLLGVPLRSLVRAFERAMTEFTGKGRARRDP